MPLQIPRLLVEFILLGPEDDRRQLQDSPLLGDVWVEFADKPDQSLELLITPYKEHSAGAVSSALAKCRPKAASIAYLQGVVAARLSFEELLQYVVPMTNWWKNERSAELIRGYERDAQAMKADLLDLFNAARAWQTNEHRVPLMDIDGAKRYIALAGLILWGGQAEFRAGWDVLPSKGQMKAILETEALESKLAELLGLMFEKRIRDQKALVFSISRNRKASAALTRSVPAIKADAAKTLFNVNCSEIVWAVIDSGIDGKHAAFQDSQGKSRIRASYDFTKIRDIVSLDNQYDEAKRRGLAATLGHKGKEDISLNEASDKLAALAEAAGEGRPIDWELVKPLVEIDPRTDPPSNHGTHVAGILGARKDGTPDGADGVCSDIILYDFRVLAPTLGETEFAIIAALQFIRYLNERNSFITIHGTNLSLSIPHDVRNYACGRTPVCNECERLVNSGVMVVAAAGNRGYQNFETKDGLYEGYAAFSVTDPGNADGVLTVGSTHRFWPHTYGVSFFSSRGPTGDGRLKPDLVAPGERIRAPLRDGAWGDLDGTSMAAPHVSGAAAMLMARYSEMIGQPRRIKQILCDSATDLGRERSFQGHGMLDVLRAFQSV